MATDTEQYLGATILDVLASHHASNAICSGAISHPSLITRVQGMYKQKVPRQNIEVALERLTELGEVGIVDGPVLFKILPNFYYLAKK